MHASARLYTARIVQNFLEINNINAHQTCPQWNTYGMDRHVHQRPYTRAV